MMLISSIQNMLTFSLFLICGPSFGQHEFLVTVNPTTGTFSKIDSLPGVRWIHTMPRYSTFDSQNQRYIFRGEDVNHNSHLYSIDAISGNIVNNPLFPILSDPNDNIVELQFDDQLNTLFGLHWDDSEQREYFVSINPSTGQHTIIDSIPTVQSIASGSAYYDQVNHRYFFCGMTNSGSRNFIIDSNTGAVLAATDYIGMTDPLDNISYTCYDYTSGKMYGLHWSNTNQKEYLVLINEFTGEFEIICEIPGVRWLYGMPNYHTYDSNNHRFFFAGFDLNMDSHLFTIDTPLGQVNSSPLFPVLSDPNDNIIELVYDNTSNQLFALHWDNFTDQSSISEDKNCTDICVYPNPFAENCVIKLNKEYHNISISLIDLSGKIVREQSESESDEILIAKERLPTGSYFVSINADNTLFEHVKVLIR